MPERIVLKSPRSQTSEASAPTETAAPDAAALRPHQLQKEAVVKIYVDPVKCTIEEGEARLLFPIWDEPDQSGMEYWRVKFPDAPGAFARMIMPGAKPAEADAHPEAKQ